MLTLICSTDKFSNISEMELFLPGIFILQIQANTSLMKINHTAGLSYSQHKTFEHRPTSAININ